MTLHLRLRNIGTLALHGRHPGEEWLIQAGDEGLPLDPLWRKRLVEEDRYNVGVIKVVGREDSNAPSPPPIVVASVPDIGPYLDLFGVIADRMDALERRPVPQFPIDSASVKQMNGSIALLKERVQSLENLLMAAIKT